MLLGGSRPDLQSQSASIWQVGIETQKKGFRTNWTLKDIDHNPNLLSFSYPDREKDATTPTVCFVVTLSAMKLMQ